MCPAIVLAQTGAVQQSPASTAGQNVFISAVILLLGFTVAGITVWAGRRAFTRLYSSKAWFDTFASVGEKLLAFSAGTVAGMFELFKPATFRSDDTFVRTLYGVEGAIIAAAFLVPRLIALAKEGEKAKIAALSGQLAVVTDQRDKVIEAVASWGAVIESKRNRLQSMLGSVSVKHTQIAEALSPSVQIQLLMQSLHGHFARHLPKPESLRVGIYMRSPESRQRLAPIYSYDGTNNNCFSNSHPEIMDLDAPGGARSLLVQCFQSDKELHMVADCAEESRKPERPFVYFSENQKTRIKSMLAYRYFLRENGKLDAMILTMDTTRTGFFSPDRELECKVVLHEIGRRIEFELVTHNLIKKLPPKKT